MFAPATFVMMIPHAHSRTHIIQTTGFKYQIINCKAGYEVIDITLNHLDSIRTMVDAADEHGCCARAGLLLTCLEQALDMLGASPFWRGQ